MKLSRLFVLTAALGIVLSMSGCELVTTDVTDLMSPPKLTGEQNTIVQTIDSQLGHNKYTLKYPASGNYRSPIILYNLDPHSKSAVAFYCPNTDKAGMHVMILKKISGKWVKVDDLNGNGSDVSKIDFGDFNGDGVEEIAIGWTLFSGTDLNLCVYSNQSGKYVKTFSENGCTDLKMIDINGDGKMKLLSLKLDTTARKATASLIGWENGKISELSQTPLDSTVNSYAQISETKINNQTVVLVDGYKGNHSMITEPITFNNFQMSSPLYDPAKKTSSNSTLRDDLIPCADINTDGIVEIPLATVLPGYENVKDSDKLWLIKWSVLNGTALNPKLTCVMNTIQGYYFIFPDNWDSTVQNVTIDRSSQDTVWTFREMTSGKNLFTIYTFNENEWKNMQSAQKNSMNKLMDNNGIVYAVQFPSKQGTDDPLVLDYASVKQRFKLIR